MKKGQIKMGETIAVLFIFFVLVLFGLVFYFQFQKSSISRQQAEFFDKKTITISQLASFLPEVACSRAEMTPIKTCIDLEKAKITKEEIAKAESYYFDLFGWGSIAVEEIYPGNGSWSLYNKALEGATRNISTSLPISVYKPWEKRYAFGVLHVEAYS